MGNHAGVLIQNVAEESLAARAGVRAGERLLALNGFPVRDTIDAFFHGAEQSVALTLEGEGGSRRKVRIQKHFDENLGLELEDFKVRRCNNECIFCFIDQNPAGMRQPVYFKDGDYRMSFLHGNYITTTNLTQADMERIVVQRLSPLYVSVHATNHELRMRMLGVKKSPPILERLSWFVRNGVQIHAQIVLCPGWNDGAELERTARELAALGPNLLTIAVVPLGLTGHREGLPALQPVTPTIARQALARGRRLQAELHRERGEPVLFFSDEWYLLAGCKWPDYRGVEALDQLENGVGMLAEFYRELRFFGRRLPRSLPAPRRVAALTGMLGAKALRPLAEKLEKIEGLTFDVIPLINTLFGRAITVSGLLPGKDFARGMKDNPGYDLYLIPGNAARGGGYANPPSEQGSRDGVFLDDWTLEKACGFARARAAIVEGGAADLARAALGWGAEEAAA